MAQIVAGRYRLERLLGSGGMSEVWLAYDEVAGERVALKRVLPGGGSEARDALLREAEIGLRLHHPNIVAVLDSGNDGGQPYLVTEYVEGPSLRELLTWRGRLPEGDVVEIGRAASAALAHAHSRGILHNDLKPENILLGAAGPKIADFGAASSLTETVGPHRARELMGTIAYLAPEVLRGEEPSPRSDIYALGLTLYEAAAGRLPFPGATPAAVAGQRLSQPAPLLRTFAPNVTPTLEGTLARALQVEPSLRFANAGAFAAALTSGPIVSHPTVVIRRNPARGAHRQEPAAASSGGRGGKLFGFVLVALLLGGGALAFVLASRDDDPANDDRVEHIAETPTPEPPTPTPTATATPTEVPDDEGEDGDDDRRGRGRNRGRGNSDDRDDGEDRRIPIPIPREWIESSPESARDALGRIWENVQDAIEREWRNRTE